MTAAKECDDRHDKIEKDIEKLFGMSIPSWIRAVFITLIGLLFLFFAGTFVYGHTMFLPKSSATEMKQEDAQIRAYVTEQSKQLREDAQQLRIELREWRKEIKQDLKDGFASIERRMGK